MKSEVFFLSNEINRRIANFRKAAGFNQATVAQRLGIKRSTYARMEAEGRMFDPEILKELCVLFNVTIEQILYGESIEKKKEENIFQSLENIQKPLRLAESAIPPFIEPEYRPNSEEQRLMHTYHFFNKDEQKEVQNLINEIYQRKKAENNE